MKKVLQILALILVIITVGGCKKGKDGEPGKDGSSNVTTRTFSVPTWSSNSSRWYTELSFPELTTDNINSASVQVYWSTVNGTWVAVPYTYIGTTNNYFMGFASMVNNIEIRWDCNSLVTIGSNPNSILGGTVQIKVVVIPPAQKKLNINLSNYSEVKAAYNLKD